MAAILFLVAILGLVLAGREQALAAAPGSAPLLRFQVWQLALALLIPLVWVLPASTPSKIIAFASAAVAFSLSALKAKRETETNDLHF